MRKAVPLGLALAVALAAATARADCAFTFPPIDGFIDVGPGAPEANLEQLEALQGRDARAAAMRSGHAAMAVEARRGDRVPYYNARVGEGGALLDQAELDRMVDTMTAPLRQKLGSSVSVVSIELRQHAAGRSGRFVIEYELRGEPMRTLVWVISSKTHVAVVAYIARGEEYAAYEPRFDRHAAGIRATSSVAATSP